MKVLETNIKGCYVIEPNVFGDERGFFLETYQKERYKKLLSINDLFVQDNHSRSSKNVLRGLHYQKTKPQGKLVRVVRGEVFDVAVDLRKESSTFGSHFSIILSEQNKKQLWIPPNFAHGFQVISDHADFEYKCTSYYDPNDEATILWDDPDINIDWPNKNPLLSDKDKKGISFNSIVL